MKNRLSPRLNTTLPARTFAELDALIERTGLSRQVLIAQAIRKLALEHRIEVSENSLKKDV